MRYSFNCRFQLSFIMVSNFSARKWNIWVYWIGRRGLIYRTVRSPGLISLHKCFVEEYYYLYYYTIVKKRCRYIEDIYKNHLGFIVCKSGYEIFWIFVRFSVDWFVCLSVGLFLHHEKTTEWFQTWFSQLRTLLFKSKSKVCFITIGWTGPELQLDH